MKCLGTAFIGCSLLVPSSIATAQVTTLKVLLMEDAGKHQWCSYLSKPTWRTATKKAQAMRVGSLDYSNGILTEIDVSETDESGDWTAYDRYFLNSQGQMTRLTRLLNVLPGDRSVSQVFLIGNGKTTRTAINEKQLSTGKPVTSPRGDWLPDVAIETDPKMFPFWALLHRPSLRTSPKSCVKVSAVQ